MGITSSVLVPHFGQVKVEVRTNAISDIFITSPNEDAAQDKAKQRKEADTPRHTGLTGAAGHRSALLPPQKRSAPN